MNTKRAIPWVALTLTVLLAGGTVAWGAPRDQWDYRRANRAGLPHGDVHRGQDHPRHAQALHDAVRATHASPATWTDSRTCPGTDNGSLAATRRPAAHQAIRTYGKGAAGAVSIEFTAEDPHDVRGGYIHYRRTEQTEPFTVFKRNGLWLFVIGSD